MKHLFLTISICITALVSVQAQKIESQKVSGGYKFRLNDKILSLSDLLIVMEPNLEASNVFSKAQGQNTLAMLVSGVGGGLLGWEFGNFLTGKKVNGGAIGAGAALIVIAIPISKAGVKNVLKAVDLYNAGLKTTSWKAQPTLHLVSKGGNGIGLVMTF